MRRRNEASGHHGRALGLRGQHDWCRSSGSTPPFSDAHNLPNTVGHLKAPSPLRFAGAVHEDFAGMSRLREKAVTLVWWWQRLTAEQGSGQVLLLRRRCIPCEMPSHGCGRELTRPDHRWLAHEYLQLPIGDFDDLKTYLPRLKSAANQIISAWKNKYPSGQNPILDLRVIAGDDNSKTLLTTDLKASNFPGTIRQGDLIWVVGQAGIGKTQSLISIGEILAFSGGLIPVLISLRDWGIPR